MKKTFDIRNKTILVTGGNGFLGKHVIHELQQHGAKHLLYPSSKELNFCRLSDVKKAVKGVDGVIHLAAMVGGIGYNREHPAEMFYKNLLMGVQLIHEAWKAGVEKFVALGTICCYPKFTPVPFKEENLWNGYPEETNAPYGLSKKMLLVQSESYRAQYNFNSIFLLPVNLYGPGDNFNPESSHVIPALIRRMIEAKEKHMNEVVVWGTGKATREFLYVEDAARAIRLSLEYYDKSDPVNIGAGFEISIKDLVEKIKKYTGYEGKIVWDKTKPDGQPRRMLDTTRAKREFNFASTTDFDTGLKTTVDWYTQNFVHRGYEKA